jgi:tetratricopeptide (TPR) repeat protein
MAARLIWAMAVHSSPRGTSGGQDIGASRRLAIDQALATGDVPTAARLAEAAVDAGNAEPLLLNLAAWQREEAGEFAAAFEFLGRALRLAPDDAVIVAAIGRAERKAGRTDAALARFDQASALDPDFAVPWLERGFALDASGALAAAGASFVRATALDPHCAPAFGGVASVAARSGDTATARQFAARALALDPREASAATALARIEFDVGTTESAAARARALVARTDLAPGDRTVALTLLGDALDRLDMPRDAFAAFSEAQAIARSRFAARFAGPPSHRDYVIWIDAAVDRIARTVTPPPADVTPAAGHAFLLGYPRSGTTMTENILASSSVVVALEERPTLAAADTAFFDDDPGLDRLASLDAATASTLRADYWANVAAHGAAVAGKIFVDMDPFKGVKLPAIARLFPRAQIILMRRDPRDVVLSCFRQNFHIGPMTYAFTELESTARHFDAVMRLIEHCRAVLPIEVHEVRYESLIADFDATTMALCVAVGVPWSPAMRTFDRTAHRRGVGTASALQVRRGLYDGSGQWRRYREQLEPVLPILAPWVERFGYPA